MTRSVLRIVCVAILLLICAFMAWRNWTGRTTSDIRVAILGVGWWTAMGISAVGLVWPWRPAGHAWRGGLVGLGLLLIATVGILWVLAALTTPSKGL